MTNPKHDVDEAAMREVLAVADDMREIAGWFKDNGADGKHDPDDAYARTCEKAATLLSSHSVSAPDLQRENKRLREALEQWKCPSCGGKGTFQQDAVGRARKEARGLTPDPHYQPDAVTCKICNGEGLHPIARSALNSASDG